MENREEEENCNIELKAFVTQSWRSDGNINQATQINLACNEKCQPKRNEGKEDENFLFCPPAFHLDL